MKIGIISPYFGSLPFGFDEWLESAMHNRLVDFYLITDQNISFDLPENINLINTSFEELCEKIGEKLKCNSSFSPYKLCDFKACYGDIFEDILEKYDYWGYCDLDLIFGDLSLIINDYLVFGKYDKIFDLGHLSFYRNTKRLNYLYNSADPISWSYIKNSKIIWVFDEVYESLLNGINKHVIDSGLSLFDSRKLFSDVLPKYIDFVDGSRMESKICYFKLVNGKLSSVYLDEKSCVVCDEKIYVHFQKRIYKIIKVNDCTKIFIPESWCNVESLEDANVMLKKLSGFPMVLNENFVRSLKIRRLNKYTELAREILFGKLEFRLIKRIFFNLVRRRNVR